MMRLASWVSVVVIALGALPFFLSYLYAGYWGFDWNYQTAMSGEKFVIFGLATLIISEIFRSLKDTKSGGRHE